eukprot:TRINITY_DN47101_c0_g1_i1.p1 TRINITY_DN47101_c0_g1~~TRINITY_DN47101_c0_g1_i1.p1  ORF type:complete len:520 (-),score=65.28 TRINITY_DN47101_c0_g1_i1:99-1475(-)
MAYAKGQWSRHIGLDRNCGELMKTFAPDIQIGIIKAFDPSLYKASDIVSEFRSFIQSSGLQQPGFGQDRNATPERRGYGPRQGSNNGQQSVEAFCRRWGFNEDAKAFLECLPSDVLNQVLEGFDGSSSNDGNVWGRLLGYCRHRWSRTLKLEPSTEADIKRLSEEEQLMLLSRFDPSGTKDGNLDSRVRYFMRSKLAHLVASVNSRLQDRPPQGPRMDNSLRAPRSRMPALDDFCRKWGLGADKAAFMQRLHPEVLQQVVEGFDAASSKDGNVWARLLGYCRHRWAKVLRLEPSTEAELKGLSEDGVVMLLSEFDAAGTKDGNLDGRVRGFLRKVVARTGPMRAPGGGAPMPTRTPFHQSSEAARAPWHSGQSRGPPNENIEDFLSRCGLDASAHDLLLSLDAAVLEEVMRSFDPSGTKDGNVKGRLEGYIRVVQRRGGVKRGPDMDDGGLARRRRLD